MHIKVWLKCTFSNPLTLSLFQVVNFDSCVIMVELCMILLTLPPFTSSQSFWIFAPCMIPLNCTTKTNVHNPPKIKTWIWEWLGFKKIINYSGVSTKQTMKLAMLNNSKKESKNQKSNTSTTNRNSTATTLALPSADPGAITIKNPSRYLRKPKFLKYLPLNRSVHTTSNFYHCEVCVNDPCMDHRHDKRRRLLMLTQTEVAANSPNQWSFGGRQEDGDTAN